MRWSTTAALGETRSVRLERAGPVDPDVAAAVDHHVGDRRGRPAAVRADPGRWAWPSTIVTAWPAGSGRRAAGPRAGRARPPSSRPRRDRRRAGVPDRDEPAMDQPGELDVGARVDRADRAHRARPRARASEARKPTGQEPGVDSRGPRPHRWAPRPPPRTPTTCSTSRAPEGPARLGHEHDAGRPQRAWPPTGAATGSRAGSPAGSRVTPRRPHGRTASRPVSSASASGAGQSMPAVDHHRTGLARQHVGERPRPAGGAEATDASRDQAQTVGDGHLEAAEGVERNRASPPRTSRSPRARRVREGPRTAGRSPARSTASAPSVARSGQHEGQRRSDDRGAGSALGGPAGDEHEKPLPRHRQRTPGEGALRTVAAEMSALKGHLGVRGRRLPEQAGIGRMTRGGRVAGREHEVTA